MTDPKPANTFCNRTRREFLWEAGAGFTGVALTALLGQDGFFAAEPTQAAANTNPLAPRPAHFAAKAKSVIFLFMYGGPSQVDTFDYKPALYPLDGQTDHGAHPWTRRASQPGASRRAEVALQAVRPIRQVGQRFVPAPGDVRGRHRLSAFDDRGFPNSRLGDAANEHRQDPLRQPVHGLVAELWPGVGQSGFARLRRHARSHRRSDHRGPRTGRAVTCRPAIRA